MTRKTARLKTTAAAVTFASEPEVDAAILAIGERQRIVADLTTRMQEELAAIKARYEAQALPHNAVIREFQQGVQIWCEAHRGTLTNARSKTYAFPSGEVSWRTRPLAVSVRGEGIVIAALKALGLDRWIRTKEEVDKNAIKNDPKAAEIVAGISGLTLSQGEDFIIKPFASQTEVVS